MTEAIVVLSVVFLYSILSRRLERWQLSAPMVFVAAGILLGEDVLGVLDVSFDEHLLLLVAEVALVIILFTDAQRIKLDQLGNLPGRLLGYGLPLTIVIGGAIALMLLTKLELWEAGLIAVILAPTDASLGEAVLTDRRVPVRIRQALNAESGLNDGIAVPLLFLFLAVAGIEEGLETTGFWVEFAIKQIGLGLLIGVAAGLIGGWLWREAARRGWMTIKFRQLAVPALALLAWLIADEIGGSGFVAAFVAGLISGQIQTERDDRDLDFAADVGGALSLTVFFVFGSSVVVGAFGNLTWEIALYAVLSLTLIRMLPVAISLIGAGLDRATIAFIGWFGPRGLASIILALVIVEEEVDLAGFDVLRTVMAVTVTLSVFAHGISAGPLAKRYGRHAKSIDEDAPDLEGVHEHPLRQPALNTGSSSADD